MQNDTTALAGVLDWLRARHAAIMATEQEALGLLADGDTKGYTEKMRAKAESVATMAKDAAPELLALPEPLRDKISRGLLRFSQSAAMGLQLGSVFYMSALLYPDDHKPGQPDNLALFIKSVATGDLH